MEKVHDELRIRPRRNRGEDGASYCARLADANGFLGVQSFCREIGVTIGGLASGRMLSTLANIGRCDLAELSNDSPANRGDGVHLAGQLLGRGLYIRTLGRRFCPQCFRADLDRPVVQLSMPREWNRVWWDIAGITACHVHVARLHSRCLCGRTSDHRQVGIGHCACGVKLSRTPRLAVETAHAAAYVVGRLGYAPRVDVPLLDELPLGDAIRGIRIFGNTLAPDADEHEVLEAGYRTIAGDAQRISDALTRISRTRPERPGAIGAYGELHAFARDTASGAGSRRLLVAMRRHANARRERSADGR